MAEFLAPGHGGAHNLSMVAHGSTADVRQIHGDLDAAADQLIADVRMLSKVPVVCASGADMSVGIDLTRRYMEQAGLQVVNVPTAGNPVLFGTRYEDPSLPTVLVYGHYDVQPAEPLDAWHSDPWNPEVREGRLYGRGVSDNKGQHVAQLSAIRATLARQGSLPCNIKMIMEGEEEIGSPNLASFVAANRDRLAADLAYTADGGLHPSGRPMVLCGARGLLYLRVELTRSARDLHSGSFGGVAPSAVRELSEALISLWDADGRVAVAGFYDDVRQPSPNDLLLVRVMPVDPESAAASLGSTPDAATLEQWYERLLVAPNLNIAGVGGGWVGTGMKTVIPGTAVASLDVRMIADQDPNRIAAAIATHLQQRVPDINVTVVGSMHPSRTRSDHPYVSLVANAVAEGWGEQPYVSPSLAGSIPDYVFTKILGLPSVIVPYANADQANHAPNENIKVANVVAGARAFVSVLAAVGTAPPMEDQ